MAAAKALLERFGLLSKEESSGFDLRLARIGRREERHQALPMLFKSRPSPSEA